MVTVLSSALVTATSADAVAVEVCDRRKKRKSAHRDGRAAGSREGAVSIAQQNTYGIVLAIGDYQILNAVVIEISDLLPFQENYPR